MSTEAKKTFLKRWGARACGVLTIILPVVEKAPPQGRISITVERA